MSINAKFRTEVLRPPQERNRRINANNIRASFRQCERMPSVAATKIDDTRTRM